jgi:hypothetical protein
MSLRKIHPGQAAVELRSEEGDGVGGRRGKVVQEFFDEVDDMLFIG